MDALFYIPCLRTSTVSLASRWRAKRVSLSIYSVEPIQPLDANDPLLGDGSTEAPLQNGEEAEVNQQEEPVEEGEDEDAVEDEESVGPALFLIYEPIAAMLTDKCIGY